MAALLVTRPIVSNMGTAPNPPIRLHSHTVYECPLFCISPRAPRMSIAHLSIYDGYIATSVAALHGAVLHYGRETLIAALAAKPIWPIGEATYKVAQNLGLHAIAPTAPYTSEALLASFSIAALPPQNLLILSGVGGRRILAQRLRAQGHRVDKLTLYERTPIAANSEMLAAFAAHDHKAILLTNGETLAALTPLLPTEWCATVRIITLSARLERLARRAGWQRVGIIPRIEDGRIAAILDERAE